MDRVLGLTLCRSLLNGQYRVLNGQLSTFRRVHVEVISNLRALNYAISRRVCVVPIRVFLMNFNVRSVDLSETGRLRKTIRRFNVRLRTTYIRRECSRDVFLFEVFTGRC